MMIMLGTVRMNLEYLHAFMACYAVENNKLHMSFTDEVKIFPVYDIEKWVKDYGIAAVSVDPNRGTVMVEFVEDKDAIEYAHYLDQFFLAG